MHRAHILIAMDAHTISQGARTVKDALVRSLSLAGLTNEVRVVETGSLGIYNKGVVLVVYPDAVYYAGVTVEDVADIVSEHIIKGRVVERLWLTEFIEGKRVAYAAVPPRFSKQVRVVLRNAGIIDPESIEEYIAHDGYEALGKALTAMSPEQVLQQVKESKIQGRGGAFFPSGLKWEFAAKEKAEQKKVKRD